MLRGDVSAAFGTFGGGAGELAGFGMLIVSPGSRSDDGWACETPGAPRKSFSWTFLTVSEAMDGGRCWSRERWRTMSGKRAIRGNSFRACL